MKCPECGKEAIRKKTQYGIRNMCCNLWSWGSAPLVSKETHDARIKAHAAFDVLWQIGPLTRKNAYKWLACELGMTTEQCHIKLMGVDDANRVVEVVKKKRKEVNS